MSRLLKIVLRAIVPVLILGAGIGGYFVLANLKKPPARKNVDAVLPLVETVTVEAHSGELPIGVDGNVVPYRLIPVSAEVSGRIVFKSKSCRSGHEVKQGDTLLQIDRADHELELERLTRQFEQAVASLQELSVQIESARQLVKLAGEDLEQRDRELKRIEKLFAMNAATDVELDDARQAHRTAQTGLVTEQKGLLLLTTQQTRLEKARDLVATQQKKARLDLARTEVKAPCDGTIVADVVEEDSFVQRGSSLFTISDSAAAEVTCRLTIDQLYWLWLHKEAPSETALVSPGEDSKPGTPSVLTPNVPVTVVYSLAGHEFVWRGVLSRFEGTGLDDRTRTVPCRVHVDNPTAVSLLNPTDEPVAVSPPKLVRGMFVSVRMHSHPRLPLLRIPEAAIRPGNAVWKVEQGRLKRLEIDVAEVIAGVALVPELTSGLKQGDRIVTSPLATETSGQRVRSSEAGHAESSVKEETASPGEPPPTRSDSAAGASE